MIYDNFKFPKLYMILKAKYLERESGAFRKSHTLPLAEKGFLLLRSNSPLTEVPQPNLVS